MQRPVFAFVLLAGLAANAGRAQQITAVDDPPPATARHEWPRGVPPVGGSLPPGLYRAGALPAPPPGFYDPSIYFLSPYSLVPGAGYSGFAAGPYVSPQQRLDIARTPYRAATADAQDYHYRNQIILRDERLQHRNRTLTREGSQLLRAGDYQRAAMVLLDAAESNHGDALARVRAGHALFALGRYAPAVAQIRRAFELQPPLATLPYDVREDYGRLADFDAHYAALRAAAAARPNDAATITMLGYVQYYTTGPGSALPALRRAQRLDRGNELIAKLLAVAEKIGPQPAYAPRDAEVEFVTPEPLPPAAPAKRRRI